MGEWLGVIPFYKLSYPIIPYPCSLLIRIAHVKYYNKFIYFPLGYVSNTRIIGLYPCVVRKPISSWSKPPPPCRGHLLLVEATSSASKPSPHCRTVSSNPIKPTPGLIEPAFILAVVPTQRWSGSRYRGAVGLAIVGPHSPSLSCIRYPGFVLPRMGWICRGRVGSAVVGLCSLSSANRRVRLVCHCIPLGHASPPSSSSSCHIFLLLLLVSSPPPPHRRVVPSPPPPRRVVSFSSSSSCCLFHHHHHHHHYPSSSPCVVSSLGVVLIVSLFVNEPPNTWVPCDYSIECE